MERILPDTHTPGLSVAIVHRDGPEWVAGLGKSDVATNQAATDVRAAINYAEAFPDEIDLALSENAATDFKTLTLIPT